jgi:predicted anti-sigma-YlaC factor YlaD
VRRVHGECERARQWASTDVDGELSAFEGVLLNAHLGTCAECRAFRSTIGQFTGALRTAPQEPFTGVHLRRVRRRAGRPFASAAAALAFVAVGLGSVVASTHLGSGLQRPATAPAHAAALVSGTHDAVNQRTLRALQRLDIAGFGRSGRSGGGPYVQQR